MINKNDLIGIWTSDSTKELGDITLEFKSNGELVYSVKENDKKQVINLVYWLEGDYIYTDQPSAPKIEKTEAKIVEGKLSLNYTGTVVSFSR